MGTRCDACGFESAVADFFRRERGGLVGRSRDVCKGCDVATPDDADRAGVLATAAWASLAAAFAWVVSSTHDGMVDPFFGAMGFVLGGPASVLLHEGGHAGIAALLGAGVSSINLGRGPPVVQRRLGRTLLTIGRYPIGGVARFAWPIDSDVGRWRFAAAILAGPLINLGASALLFWLADALSQSRVDAFDIVAAFGWGLAVSQAGMGAFNLWPSRSKGSGPDSDGRQLLDTIFVRPSVEIDDADLAMAKAYIFGKMGHSVAALKAAQQAHSLRPDSAATLSSMMHCIAEVEGHEAAMSFYRRNADAYAAALVSEKDEDRTQAVWLKANLAWSALQAGNPDDLPFAERLSREAHEHDPSLPATLGTLGGVLGRIGDVAAGRDLLTMALRKAEPGDRAQFSAELARLEREAGEEALAEAYEHLREHIISTDSARA